MALRIYHTLSLPANRYLVFHHEGPGICLEIEADSPEQALEFRLSLIRDTERSIGTWYVIGTPSVGSSYEAVAFNVSVEPNPSLRIERV